MTAAAIAHPARALRLDAIVRVSDQGAREYLRSDAQQERDVRAWAAEHGHEVVHVHRAIDQSAGKGAYPAIEDAKQRALDGVTDGIVVAYLSRYSRHTLYGLQTVATLLDAGRWFFAIDCPFDLRSKEGRKYLTNQLAEAEFEWHVRRENFARGVSEAIERGVHLTSTFGYEREDGKGTPFVIVDPEADVVRLVYQLRAEGHSWPSIAKRANATGVLPRPRRHKRTGPLVQSPWTWKTVRGLVFGEHSKPRRVYLGVAWNGEHECIGAHEPIVTRAVFDAATGARGVKPVGPDEGHVLSGLCRCATCGYVLIYAGSNLRCKEAMNGRCDAPAHARADHAETFALDAYERLMADLHLLPARATSEADELDAVADDANAEVASLIDLGRTLGKMTPSERAAFSRSLNDARARARDAEQAAAQARAREQVGTIRPDLHQRPIRELAVEDQRYLLSTTIAAIVVRPARRYREPVAERVLPLGVHEAPTDSAGLIAHVAGIDF